MPLNKELAKAEYRGTVLNMKAHKALMEEYTKEQEELLIALRSNTYPEFNPNAPEQVLKVFFANPQTLIPLKNILSY